MSIDDYYEETPLDQPDNLGSLTYQNRRTYVIDDLHDAGFAPAQSRFTSALSIPFGDSGLFQIAAEEKGAFDDTDKRLAELLTEHAVAAIDRIEREQELERRAEELEEKNERLDEFASIVSHDLRNPLNVATLRADHTLRTGEIESVEAIQDALDRMVTIIGDVLTLARQGQGIEEVNPVTLHQLTAQSWEQILTENASLNVEQGVVIEADGGRLEHLFENLFRNAIDHAGDDVTVRVGTLPESDGFFVEDDGPGIDEEIRDHVFERGYSEADSGTGLGLAIVREVVQAHGWEIRVTESSNGGARFEITGVEFVDQTDI